jgi:hypothetical protein
MPEIGKACKQSLFEKWIYQEADKKRTLNVNVQGSLGLSFKQD